MARNGRRGLRKARWAVEYAGFKLCQAVFRWLPQGWVLGVGGLLGRIWYGLDQRHRRVALDNLRMAFPDLDDAERRHLAAAAFQNIGKTLVEFLRFPAYDKAFLEEWVEIVGEERIQRARHGASGRTRQDTSGRTRQDTSGRTRHGASGRARQDTSGRTRQDTSGRTRQDTSGRTRQDGSGILFLSGHCGNWELIPLIMAMRGRPMAVVARPLDNPQLDREVVRSRTLWGTRVLDKRQAIRQILAALTQGQDVGILLDQRVSGAEGVGVPFFGHPAGTSRSPALLALKTRAPVIPVFIHRIPGGRHRLEFGEPLALIDRGDREQNVIDNTALYTQAIEAHIREHPAEWFWVHRRWKQG